MTRSVALWLTGAGFAIGCSNGGTQEGHTQDTVYVAQLDSMMIPESSVIDSFAHLRGNWIVKLDSADPDFGSPDDSNLDMRSFRITTDSVLMVGADGEETSNALVSIERGLEGVDDYVVRTSDLILCLYFQPNAAYVNHCCDDCPTARIERENSLQ